MEGKVPEQVLVGQKLMATLVNKKEENLPKVTA